MTHYKVLGVPRNASAATIKARYRVLVKQHHPDRGGDPELFKAIAHAYAILSDPAKRRRYDETGDDERPGVDPEHAKRMQTIELVLNALLDSDSDKLRYQNIPALITEAVRDRIEEVSKSIAAAQRERDSIARLIDRIKTKLPGVEEPISAILKTRMASCDISIAAAQRDVAMLTSVVEILDGLVDTPEERPAKKPSAPGELTPYQRNILESLISDKLKHGLFG